MMDDVDWDFFFVLVSRCHLYLCLYLYLYLHLHLHLTCNSCARLRIVMASALDLCSSPRCHVRHVVLCADASRSWTPSNATGCC